MDPAAELEQLRERAAVEGNEWLRMKLQAENLERLVPLGRAAKLQVFVGTRKVGKADLVAMLVEELGTKAAGPKVA